MRNSGTTSWMPFLAGRQTQNSGLLPTWPARFAAANASISPKPHVSSKPGAPRSRDVWRRIRAMPAVAVPAWLAARAWPERPAVAGAFYGLGTGVMADAGEIGRAHV